MPASPQHIRFQIYFLLVWFGGHRGWPRGSRNSWTHVIFFFYTSDSS